MSAIPANVRVNIGAPFPSLVKGSPQGLIAVAKQNGIWTVTLNYAAMGLTPVIADPNNSYVLIYNPLTGLYAVVPISTITSNKSVRIITTVGPQAAQPADDVIIIKQAVAAAFNLTVDWSARTKPLRVVDGRGDAAVNNITITPTAGQSQLAQVNYVYTIDQNGGSIILTPLPDGTGAY